MAVIRTRGMEGPHHHALTRASRATIRTHEERVRCGGDDAAERFGARAYLVGFGTHSGTVAAAYDWGDPMTVMRVRPSHDASYERLCHDADAPAFLLPLRC